MPDSNVARLESELAEDCAKEELFISQKRLSEFKPCNNTLNYLSRNDVRPLKKVSEKKLIHKSGQFREMGPLRRYTKQVSVLIYLII